MILATSLFSLTVLCPVVSAMPQGRIKLPERPQQAQPQNVPPPLTEIERFRHDIEELAQSPGRVEQRLQAMALQYGEINDLVIEVARGARAREMTHLMLVARRFGDGDVARELRFQLLARRLGRATRPVIDAMTFLMGPERDPDDQLDERQALRDVIRGRQAGARRPATEALAEIATEADLPFALELTSHQSLDLRLRGVDLLTAIDAEGARQRLVQLLSKPPALAGAACHALIQLGERAVPELQAILAGAPIDRGFAYAAFALAEIGNATGQSRIDPTRADLIAQQLRSREALTRSLAAVALADLGYRAGNGEGTVAEGVIDDRAIGDALVDLVDARLFVPNLDLLKFPAEQRLTRMTGRVVQADSPLTWRQWWEARRDGFVGLRAAVSIDARTAATAVVTLRAKGPALRLLAEGLTEVAPLENSHEAFLTGAQMLELVEGLQRLGFGDPRLTRQEAGLPIARSLEVQVGRARAFVGVPAGEDLAFGALADRVEQALESQLWQLYRHPEKEPDRAAFWRAERRWLAAHESPVERGQRFARRVLANWTTYTPWLRARALEHLFEREDRKLLLGEAEGDAVLAVVRGVEELSELELRLLELAAGIPGDRIWRECVAVAATVPGGGRDAVRAVFAVLGPEAVLTALADERPVVRRVAIDEIVVARDMRAGPRLVELLTGESEPDEVRRAAAEAAGQLRLPAAQDPLVQLIIKEATVPGVRRAALVALGRVGGKNAFPVLDQALRAPVPADREAALRGLGELRDQRAAHTLAELAVIANGKDLGNLARLYLGRMGAQLAVPALRRQVKMAQNPAIHDELVLLLGRYQDPETVPALLPLLRNPQHAADAKLALMGTTGLDLESANDAWSTVEAWWRRHRAEPQWRWLLDALAAADVPTLLRPEHFQPGGIEPIPELARLLTDLRQPRLYVLASAVLRQVSGQDYGVVAMATPPEARAGIAARYRVLFETRKAAKNQ